jgi:ATP-dependent Clp protease protease subunit
MSNEVVFKDSKFENAQQWLQMGIDLESRRIQLDMDVSDVMASLVIRAVVKMSDISHEPIEIYLSSFGGDLYSGMSIYDTLRECPCDIIIHANGKIMSAGLLIFLAGDIRVAAPHTTFMVHSVSFGSDGKLKDLEIDVAEGKRLNNLALDIITERTKKPKKLWYRLTLSHDKYFNAAEAKEYGILTNSPVLVKKVKKAKVSKNVRRKSKK